MYRKLGHFPEILFTASRTEIKGLLGQLAAQFGKTTCSASAEERDPLRALLLSLAF
jgi:hypothetical protein